MYRGMSLRKKTKTCRLEVRKLTLSGGFPQELLEADPHSFHPMRRIVSGTSRQNLIKTFQTSFGPQCGAKKLPHRVHLTPRRSEAGVLLHQLKGEPTNHCNAFCVRFRSRSRCCSFAVPQQLSLKIH